MSDTIEKVKDIVAQQLHIEKSKIEPNSSFIDDLGADSLDTVELVMALEEGFDTEISDEDAETLKTVKDVVDYIEKNA